MKKFKQSLQDFWTGKKKLSELGKSALRVLAICLAVVIFLFILTIAALFGSFNWLESEVMGITGLDSFLVKGITFLLLAFVLGTPLSGMVYSFFPVPQKNKKRKRFILLSVLAVLCLISYFASKNVYFNPENGKPNKYYSLRPNGEYKFFNSDGYDPETGDKLKPASKEVVIKHLGGIKNSENTVNDKASQALENTVSNQSHKVAEDVGQIDQSILIGAEKNAHFYPVTFINETGRNIYLCASFRNDKNSPIIIKQILVDGSEEVKLMEGRHIFAFMDASGLCYGNRNGGTLLTKSGDQLRVEINKQQYYLNNTFLLDVTASNAIVITLRDNRVLHNSDTDNDEDQANFFKIGIGVFIGLCFLLLIINLIEKESKKAANRRRGR